MPKVLEGVYKALGTISAIAINPVFTLENTGGKTWQVSYTLTPEFNRTCAADILVQIVPDQGDPWDVLIALPAVGNHTSSAQKSAGPDAISSATFTITSIQHFSTVNYTFKYENEYVIYPI